MPQAESEKTGMTQAGENLFNFAVDREDVKVFIENLPKETKCNSAAVEYELQLLKIISTGWSISFFFGRCLPQGSTCRKILEINPWIFDKSL
jgi:hypothetical protein